MLHHEYWQKKFANGLQFAKLVTIQSIFSFVSSLDRVCNMVVAGNTAGDSHFTLNKGVVLDQQLSRVLTLEM